MKLQLKLWEEIIALDKDQALEFVALKIDQAIEYGEDRKGEIADLMRLYLEYYD